MNAGLSDRHRKIDDFLQRTGYGDAIRRPLAGDASFRRYERITHQSQSYVLMDAPPPWENVQLFIAVSQLLGECGVSVPAILATDTADGFLLLEDLGDALYSTVLKKQPQLENNLYCDAVAALIQIQQASARIGAALPPYDTEIYLREAALLVEWFMPQIVGIEAARALHAPYCDAWRGVLKAAPLEQSTLVHRDYHADNLLWLENRSDYRAVGMLDYQDALWGDPAYDLVSLLEDARRDVSPQTVQACLAQFRAATGADETGFAARYAVLGAQRNAKIIGIFTRLCVRDGKAHYLEYLPRVWGHFMQDLAHPSLAPIRQWVEAHVLPSWRGSFVADAGIGGLA